MKDIKDLSHKQKILRKIQDIRKYEEVGLAALLKRIGITPRMKDKKLYEKLNEYMGTSK